VLKIQKKFNRFYYLFLIVLHTFAIPYVNKDFKGKVSDCSCAGAQSACSEGPFGVSLLLPQEGWFLNKRLSCYLRSIWNRVRQMLPNPELAARSITPFSSPKKQKYGSRCRPLQRRSHHVWIYARVTASTCTPAGAMCCSRVQSFTAINRNRS
jgi:hypothetical protein